MADYPKTSVGSWHEEPMQEQPRRRAPHWNDARTIAEDANGKRFSNYLSIIEKTKRPMVTIRNGFARGLILDEIICGFRHEGALVFGVRFKKRKTMEVVTCNELTEKEPRMLQRFYCTMGYMP